VSSTRAYLDALRMLARRELSEAQVRQRLARRSHDADQIDEAVARLKQEGAIDDRRVADAIARSETSLRKRGRLRVKRKIESAGISSSVAKHATDETFDGLDADALLEAALAKRLRYGKAVEDDREFSRLYRYLVGQGFEPDRVLVVLRRRR
jgi:regulatory protein